MSTNADTELSPTEPIQLTAAEEFDTIVDRDGAVLVDFYADWCGPCQMMEPTVEAIAAENDVSVLKVDVDAFQSLAAEYGVQGIPTLLVFADGELAEQLVGAQTKEALLRTIDGV